MEWIAVVVIAALIFGVCFLVDKAFTKIFRNQQQHHSGLAVRLSKRYASIGLLVFVLGLSGLFAGLSDGWVLIVTSAILMLVGIALVVYYLTFGVFYDEETFLLTSFGKKSSTYMYKDICAQQLYQVYGKTVIELYLKDKRTVQLQAGMDGAYPFLDKAFTKWLEQTGRRQEDCDFYDPQNSCWFPKMED